MFFCRGVVMVCNEAVPREEKNKAGEVLEGMKKNFTFAPRFGSRQRD